MIPSTDAGRTATLYVADGERATASVASSAVLICDATRSVPSSTSTTYAGDGFPAVHTTVSIAPSNLVEFTVAVEVSSVVVAAGPMAAAPSTTTEINGFALVAVNGKRIVVSDVVCVVPPTLTWYPLTPSCPTGVHSAVTFTPS